MPIDQADLRALPKVELHVHLEGTVSAATAAELARTHGEDPAEVLVLGEDGPDGEPRYPAPFRDFDQFVDCFVATSRQLRRPADLTTATAAFVAAQRSQGVVWTEATFTATTLVWQGWDPDAMWDAVLEGLDGAPIGIIVDTPRDLPVEVGRHAIELVARGRERGVPIVGFGVTGREKGGRIEDFAFLGAEARATGLGFAVHAGETGGADQVARALDNGAQRIGHGVAALDDDEVVARLVDEQVVCEVCPSSNVTLQVADDHDSHPLPAMVAAGIPVTINSDDPPFFDTTLSGELRHAERLLDLDREGHAALQRQAAAAAFCDDQQRAGIVAAIDAWARR